MLPSSEIRWLRGSAVGLALLAALSVLSLLPARQALLAIWPMRVQELVLSDGELRFRPSNLPRQQGDILASTYPLRLLALEFADGSLDYGFLIHEDTERRLWKLQSGQGWLWVDRDQLRRAYAPNALSLGDRLRLSRLRLLERRSGSPPRPEETAGDRLDAEIPDLDP